MGKKIEEIELELRSAINRIFQRKFIAMQLEIKASPREIPIPEELKRDLERALRYRSQAGKKAVECLKYIQECLRGTDEEVLRRFKKASNKVAKQTLDNYLESRNEEILTQWFLNAFEVEVDKLFEEQRKYTKVYPPLTQKERELYISEEVESQYPFLPRYLKALLTQYPSLLTEEEIQREIIEIQRHLARGREIFKEIEEYAIAVYIALLKNSIQNN
ncbi:MAG: hypothetical protein QXJ68_08670 [Methanocellales archaeon]